MSDVDIIRRLREENDELREELRQLRENVSRSRAQADLRLDLLPSGWKLRPTVRVILVALSDGATIPKQRLHEIASETLGMLVGSDRKPRRDAEIRTAPEAIIAVQLSKAKRRLAELGITITSVWGVGLRLEGESLEIVRNALKGGKEP